MSDIENIINNHEKIIEQLKNQINDNDEINQKLALKEKLLTEQNYLLELYKIKNIKECNSVA